MTPATRIPERPALGRWQRIAAALVPVAITAFAGSAATQGEIQGWYAGLNKPFFNPPVWVFPLAWTILYAMIAVSLWRLLGAMPATGPSRRGWWLALVAFLVGLGLNAAWTPVFFGAHAIGPALVVVVGMLVMVLWTIRLTLRFDRIAAWLLIPYAAWVAFATLLTAAILRIN